MCSEISSLSIFLGVRPELNGEGVRLALELREQARRHPLHFPRDSANPHSIPDGWVSFAPHVDERGEKGGRQCPNGYSGGEALERERGEGERNGGYVMDKTDKEGGRR